MDERGRVPLPPRYRDAFREGIVLSQGSPDRCVRVSTLTAFTQQAGEYTSQPPMHRRGRTMRRALFPLSHDTELDKQNRVLIPGSLRDYAGLNGKVYVVGMGEFLEIWSPEDYAVEMERVQAQLESTLESVETRER